MTDEISLEARLAVTAGYAYAAGKSGATWAAAVDEGIRKAASSMNGPHAKLAQAVLDSSVFKGEYRGYTLEESSTRLIVEIYTGQVNERSKRKDGVEEIRTDRTDTFLGKLMKKRLDAIDTGTNLLVFKSLQAMSGSSDKVKILAHFEVLGPKQDLASTGNAHSGPPETAQEPLTRQPEPSKPAEATSPPPNASAGRDDDPFDTVSVGALIGELPGAKVARLAKLARAHGIENIMMAEVDLIRELIATLE